MSVDYGENGVNPDNVQSDVSPLWDVASTRSTPTPIPYPGPDEGIPVPFDHYENCTDNDINGTLGDKDGPQYNCAWYAANRNACGAYDADWFKAKDLCCGCYEKSGDEVTAQGGCRTLEDGTQEGCEEPCTLDWFSPPDYITCEANPDPPVPPQPVYCTYHDMFVACDNNPADEKLTQDEAAACFATNCDAIC